MEEYDEFGNLIIKEEEEVDALNSLIPSDQNDDELYKNHWTNDSNYNENSPMSVNENIFGDYADYIPFSDVISDSVKAAKTAYSGAMASDETLNLGWGKLTEDKIDAYKKAQENVKTYGQSDEALIYDEKVKQYKEQGDSGLLSSIKAMMDTGDPGGYLLEIMAGSMAGLAGSAVANPALMSTGTAVGAGGGAATSAAATALATGWTGPIGAGLTAIASTAGAVSGGFLGARSTAMGIMETSTTFADELKKRIIEKGGDPTNSADIRAIMEDPEAVSDMRFKAAARGATIASIEAISGGIAGSVGAKIAGKGVVAFQAGNITRSQLAKTSAKGLGASTLIEGVGGSVGEAAGMLAAGQELAGDEIFLEGIAGTVMAPASLSASLYEASKAKKNAPPSYTFNGEQTTRESMIEMIKSPDADFMKMKFKATNDPEINAQITARRESILSGRKYKATSEALDLKDPSAVKNAKKYSQVDVKQPDAFSTINKDIAENNAKEIQPSALSEEFKQSQKEKNRLKDQLKETEVINDPNVAQAIREKLININEKEVEASSQIVEAITDLSPEQGAQMINLNDSISVYQDIIKDLDQPADVKAIAFEKVQELQKEQMAIFTSPMVKNMELSDKAQNLYDTKGIEATNEIINTQEGLIRRTAINILNKTPQFKRYEGDVDALVSELRYGPGGVESLIKTYDPSTKVPIGAYIAGQLPRRANRAIKKVISQAERSEALETEVGEQLTEDSFDFEVQIGSKVFGDQLNLPLNIIEKAKLEIPTAMQNVVSKITKADAVAKDSGKKLTTRQRMAIADKSLTSIFDSQRSESLIESIKKEFGKNTKTKQDFTNYLNANSPSLTKAFVNQKAGKKGTGITKEWFNFPPSRAEFVEYFEGKDLKPATRSDRKAALAEAVSNQIAFDLQAEYLNANPEIAKQINKEVNESVEKERNIIIASSIPGIELQESSKISEEDITGQTKDWNKQIPGDEKTLIIDNKKNQQDKNSFKTWVKDTMVKYFPKEFFFMNRGGSFTNSSSRMAYQNQQEITSELEGVDFIKDNSGINWSIVGRINYSALAKKGTKYLVGRFKGRDKGEVALNELKRNFKEIKAQGKENMKVLKYASQQFAKMYRDNPDTAKYIATWFKSASNNQDHILRFAAPLTAFSKNLSSGLREEHSLPSSLVGKYLFNAILNNNVDNSFKDIERNYFQVALSVKADNKLKGDGFNFTSRMPDGWRMTDSTWARYFNNFVNSNNNGIDPDGIEFFDTGFSVAETFKIGLNKIKTNPDLISFQQKVLAEKTSPTETVIASAKEEMYDKL